MPKRRPCDLASSSPCDRAHYRRLPALFRRGAPRGGGGAQPSDPLMYGLSSLSTLSRMETASGGGEAGTATDFGFAVMFRYDQYLSVNGSIYNAINGSTGWTAETAGFLFTMGAFSAGGAYYSATLGMTPSDVGRIFLAVFRLTPAGSTMTLSRTAVPSANVLINAKPSSPSVNAVGARANATNASTNTTYLGSLAFRGVPSDAQVASFMIEARTLGDMPQTIGGFAPTHRHSVKEELRGVSNPAGRKVYGARAFTATSRLATAANLGLRGSASMWGHWYGRLDALATAFELLVSCTTGGNDGWQIYLAASGAINFMIRNGANNANALATAANNTITAADLARPQQLQWTYDGTTLNLYLRRALVATATSSGFTAAGNTIPMIVGGRPDGGIPGISETFFGLQGCDGYVPSLVELQAAYDATELAGTLQPIPGTYGASLPKTAHRYDPNADITANALAMPATIADRVGSDTLTRVGTLEVAIDVATAPPCPAQLTDTVTRASADALARVGSPTVKTIDPTRDGQRTLGVQGASTTNYLQTAAGVGLLGSTAGFWGSWYGRFDASAFVGSGILIENLVPTSLFAGLGLSHGNGNQINATVANAAGALVNSSVFTLATTDVGLPALFFFVHTGAGNTLRLYVKRWGQPLAQVGADVACVGYSVPAGKRTCIGAREGGTLPLSNMSFFGASGGDGFVPTLAELSACADEVERTGQIQGIAGKTTALWNPTADTVASGVDAVPAQVNDRVGVAHLARQGIDVRSTANAIRAVGPYGNTEGWATAPGGGIQGQNAGFHVVVDAWFTRVPSGVETKLIAHAANSGATTGWFFQYISSAFRIGIAGTGVLLSAGTITAPDLNKRTRLVINKTAGVVQIWRDGVQQGSDAAATGFSPNTANVVPMSVGSFYGSQGFDCGYIESVTGGQFALTNAEIVALSADLTAAPPNVAGKTQKRYIFEQDVAAASGALPVRSVERISGSDDMIRLGSPLTLAQRTERVWSYEQTPTLRGFLMPVTFADGFEASNVQIGNTTLSWWLTVVCSFNLATAGGKRFLHRSTGSAGFLALAISGTTWSGQAANAAGTMTSGATSLVGAADLNKLAVLSLVWDHVNGRLRTYYKRAEVGSGVVLTNGYTPDTGILSWGCIRSAGGSGQSDAPQFGLCGGNAMPSTAEILAQHDAILAGDGEIKAIAGKTAHLWNGNRLPASGLFVQGVTTIPDEIGTAHMVLGTSGGISVQPARADVYGRAFNV